MAPQHPINATIKITHPRISIIMATLFAVKVSSMLEKFLISETISEPKTISNIPHICGGVRKHGEIKVYHRVYCDCR